jgi:hypothetical protein
MLSTIEFLTGLSYPTLFSLWLGMITLFGGLYATMTWVTTQHGITNIGDMPSLHGLLSAIYFSVITSCTVGFGDIVPIGLSRFFAAMESILAVFMVGIFISKISLEKQEVALRQVHKLSFDTIFHQIRSELFVLRRDFDLIIDEAHAGKVSDKAWMNLSTACYVCQALLEDIPDFYNSDSDLYTINRKREVLLLDAVNRTLKQTEALIRALYDAQWETHSAEQKRIIDLLKTIDILLPQWRAKSPHNHDGLFAELKKEAMRLHEEVREWEM